MAANLKPHSHPDTDPSFSGWQPTPVPAPTATPQRVKTWQYVVLGFAATTFLIGCVAAAAFVLASRSAEPAAAPEVPVASTAAPTSIVDESDTVAPATTLPPVATEAPATTQPPSTTVPESAPPETTVPPPATTEPPADDPTNQDQEPLDLRVIEALNTASLNLAKLESTPASPATSFNRAEYGTWSDDDNDCQTTDTEILIRNSETPVEFDTTGCFPISGVWADTYTGQPILTANQASVIKTIPLSEVHRSGGAEWDAATKARFVNDLDHPGANAIITRATGLVRGDKTPDAWMPEGDTAACGYSIDWISVKFAWGLSVTDAERAALSDGLVRCTTKALSELDINRLVTNDFASETKTSL